MHITPHSNILLILPIVAFLFFFRTHSTDSTDSFTDNSADFSELIRFSFFPALLTCWSRAVDNYVGFVAAAVSMPMGGCRARRSLVVVVDVSVATELTVL